MVAARSRYYIARIRECKPRVGLLIVKELKFDDLRISKTGMHLRSLIITCPTTHKDIDTGYAMTKEAFDASKLRNCRLKKCPRCGKTHIWRIQDARLLDRQVNR